MIFNSFTYSGVSNSLDESKDYQFREYEYMEKEMRLFKLKMMISYI